MGSKETIDYINKEKRLLRPYNLISPSPGKGFEIFNSKNGYKVAVLNLMGNIFMKKCDDVFEAAKKFTLNKVLKKDYDLLVVDIHGEITSEKMAMGHFFDGQATLVIGTHTHVPTSDTMILKKKFEKHYPAIGEATLCGSIIECDIESGLAKNIKQFIYGGMLKNSN